MNDNTGDKWLEMAKREYGAMMAERDEDSPNGFIAMAAYSLASIAENLSSLRATAEAYVEEQRAWAEHWKSMACDWDDDDWDDDELYSPDDEGAGMCE